MFALLWYPFLPLPCLAFLLSFLLSLLHSIAFHRVKPDKAEVPLNPPKWIILEEFWHR